MAPVWLTAWQRWMQVLLSLWLPLSAMGFSPSIWCLQDHQAAALRCWRAAVSLQGRAHFMAAGELPLHSECRVATAPLKTRAALFLMLDAVNIWWRPCRPVLLTVFLTPEGHWAPGQRNPQCSSRSVAHGFFSRSWQLVQGINNVLKEPEEEGAELFSACLLWAVTLQHHTHTAGNFSWHLSRIKMIETICPHQQQGLAPRLLSIRLYQERVLARALKINIKMEICISKPGPHALLWRRSISPAPVSSSNVPLEVPTSNLCIC